MNDFVKGMIIFALLVLIVSPVDFVPGPVDDIVMLLLTVACKRYSPKNRTLEYSESQQDSGDSSEHFEW